MKLLVGAQLSMWLCLACSYGKQQKLILYGLVIASSKLFNYYFTR